ncbi:MAG: MOFRL family protein, partial [Aquisalimonadaceae bacterium]
FATITRHIVASNGQARDAVVRRAQQLELPVVHHRELLTGDALMAGERIAEAVIHGPAGVQLWGGETTVALPENPGRGGRAQALALRAAMAMEGHHGLWLLAAGTDGTDGPGEDAGALVDTETCFRGRQSGLDPDTCLEAADSGSFLDASGDLLRTGPTGTNVMDLLISLKI